MPVLMSKQATLFRTWGVSGKPQRGKGKAPIRSNDKKGASSHSPSHGAAEEGSHEFEDVHDLDNFFEDDISDELMILESEPAPSGSKDTPVSLHNTSILEDVPGFDPEAGSQWIYPINYPIRDYQFNIVQKCLFRNTLVCLPTGLGKTFIAAVVMYNFYRWYPDGKVVFLAPTKPLVGQQIEACHNIMGIPQAHLAEMTGIVPQVSICINIPLCVCVLQGICLRRSVSLSGLSRESSS